MDIIQQIAHKMIEEIFEKLRSTGLNDIGKAIKELQTVVSSTTLQIVKACVEAMDSALVNDAKAERRQDKITVKERNVERTFMTEIGELKYARTYFKLADGTYAYLLDQIIGVEAYERISKELIAEILQTAAGESFQRSIEASGQNISRQTVHNRLLAINEVTADMERAKETPEKLDIFADEDHAHLNPKGSAIVPLVTITEGIDTTNPKRHMTIKPFHMAEYGMENAAFRENVLAVLMQGYDLDRVKQINIHADGGTWIQELERVLPNARLVMDGYHLEKHLKAFLSLDGASSYAGVIRKAMSDEHGLEKVKGYCNAVSGKQTDVKKKEQADNFRKYCENHWKAIVLRAQTQQCGSCTEPLVSHILSERLSRDPIAWSKEGLRKMTMIVVYTKNGRSITGSDIRIRNDRKTAPVFSETGYAKYNDYAIRQANEVMNSKFDWSLFDSPSSSSGKVDGSYLIRKAFGSFYSLHDIVA